MSFNPNKKGSQIEYELIPKGPHMARCARVIEIGEQDGMYGKQNKVVISFALPNVLMKMGDGTEKQRLISNPFGITLSTDEKSTMYKYTKALDPNGTAERLGDFLNAPCQVVIGHNTKEGKTRDRLDSVSPILPGIPVPDLDIDPYWFEWENPSQEVWRKIPKFTQELIRKAANLAGSKVEKMLACEDAGQTYVGEDEHSF